MAMPTLAPIDCDLKKLIGLEKTNLRGNKKLNSESMEFYKTMKTTTTSNNIKKSPKCNTELKKKFIKNT